ncbi:tight adherence protein B [Roseibium hamelinense]|uniref:Tight adherence protein B n=1 Tax=Roseibium hamelinense TaxID=150831 RepID=A0A562SHT5_9HYPH|nr:type II secretion system F family protein [Roseibium hamelinense]TWI80792.1 tight adherence protein B [Roseibium hamelinense]
MLESLSNPNVQFLLVAILVSLSIGGLIYAAFEPTLSGRKQREQRMSFVAERPQSSDQRKSVRDTNRKKKSVQDQLKEFEERQKAKQSKQKNLSLTMRIEQAGLTWSRRQFVLFSLAAGVVFGVLGLVLGGGLLVAAGLGFAGAFGFPRWYLGFKKKSRLDSFLDELPNAVDIIVRGVRAGLPLSDCIRIVAREARDPVKTEFQKILETQVMGISLTEAVLRLPDRVPVPEANFFAIVISIQQKAGGGLADALGNLARVLRGRKSMKRKIKAMSSEAKASAGIIGSLPIFVTGLLYLVAPEYISVIFTEPSGNYVLIGCGLWMMVGIFVMRQMINFDF